MLLAVNCMLHLPFRRKLVYLSVKVPVKDGNGKNRFRWTLRDQSLEADSILQFLARM